MPKSESNKAETEYQSGMIEIKPGKNKKVLEVRVFGQKFVPESPQPTKGLLKKLIDGEIKPMLDDEPQSPILETTDPIFSFEDVARSMMNDPAEALNQPDDNIVVLTAKDLKALVADQPSNQAETVDGYKVHTKDQCTPPCPFHAPSDHPLKNSPMLIRSDKNFLVERLCEHSIGHSDPDSVAYMEVHGIKAMGVHGCDGCCTGETLTAALPPHEDSKPAVAPDANPAKLPYREELEDILYQLLGRHVRQDIDLAHPFSHDKDYSYKDYESAKLINNYKNSQSKEMPSTIDAIQSLITRAQVDELQQIADLTPCNAHEKPSCGCADWIHDNVMQRISELNQENNES